MVYFISGHRNITKEEFEKYYVTALNYIFLVDRTPTFVVGDCSGADSMAQDYLAERVKKCDVTVYHMMDKPRYLASELFKTKGGYTSDISRDTAMTNASNLDIAFIRNPDKDSGTRQNIIRRYTMK